MPCDTLGRYTFFVVKGSDVPNEIDGTFAGGGSNFGWMPFLPRPVTDMRASGS